MSLTTSYFIKQIISTTKHFVATRRSSGRREASRGRGRGRGGGSGGDKRCRGGFVGIDVSSTHAVLAVLARPS